MTNRHDDIDVDELIDSLNLDKGLHAAFSELNADELAALLADFANSANLPTASIKKARINLPSFSTEKWSKFAREYGLPLSTSYFSLAPFITPGYRLPPSFHETMFEISWRWQDVYREKGNHETRMRLLELYIVPIVALFQGRIIDEPEHVMAETQYSTGGDIDHEIFMIGGILFLVIEFKLGYMDQNNLAQLFLELLSTAKQNNQLDFAGLRVYGLLTDLSQFKFYSYNPTTKEFCYDEEIIINNRRIDLFHDLIEVSNKIFGIILTAYMDGLRAIISRRKDRAQQNYFSSQSSAPDAWMGQSNPSKPSNSSMGEDGGHKSTDQWEAALGLAECCVGKFNDLVTSIQEKGEMTHWNC